LVGGCEVGGGLLWVGVRVGGTVVEVGVRVGGTAVGVEVGVEEGAPVEVGVGVAGSSEVGVAVLGAPLVGDGEGVGVAVLGGAPVGVGEAVGVGVLGSGIVGEGSWAETGAAGQRQSAIKRTAKGTDTDRSTNFMIASLPSCRRDPVLIVNHERARHKPTRAFHPPGGDPSQDPCQQARRACAALRRPTEEAKESPQ
jgi:hypothetical protein